MLCFLMPSPGDFVKFAKLCNLASSIASAVACGTAVLSKSLKNTFNVMYDVTKRQDLENLKI